MRVKERRQLDNINMAFERQQSFVRSEKLKFINQFCLKHKLSLDPQLKYGTMVSWEKDEIERFLHEQLNE